MAALRSCGALLLLIALVWFAGVPTNSGPSFGPSLGRTAAQPGSSVDSADLDDGGECGGDEESEELIDCGSDLETRIDEPLAIAILRRTEVRTTKEQCQELLVDIWEQESCIAQGRECGKLVPGGMPGPTPKLASSSASGQSVLTQLSLDPAPSQRLGRPTDEHMPKLRDLSPPVPPPKLAAC